MLYYLLRNVIVVVILKRCLASDELNQDSALRKDNEMNFKETFFSSLEDYHVKATAVSERTYPWIARVVHSRTSSIPHVCTASFVDKGIFITAARCIFNLKVKYTSIVFRSKRLPVRAFVFPTTPTAQYFDDVGFIVIEPSSSANWTAPVKLFTAKRTDKTFKWFSKMKFAGAAYKVVGFACSKSHYKLRSPYRQYNLTELPITIGLDICSNIMTLNNTIHGFKVPCYHSCSVKEFFEFLPNHKQSKNCSKYHGVEGGAVYDTKNKILFGVATWGAYFEAYDLPVGFSVVNSPNFFEDFECAKKVRDAKGPSYQNVCKKA